MQNAVGTPILPRRLRISSKRAMSDPESPHYHKKDDASHGGSPWNENGEYTRAGRPLEESGPVLLGGPYWWALSVDHP